MSMIRLRIKLVVVAACAVLVLAGFGGGSSRSTPKAEAQQFLNELDQAVREGNTEFRVGRLHPVVIQRYGEQQCRDFLATQVDKTRRTRVKSVRKEEPFEYSNDGAPPVNALLVQVRATIKGKKGDRNLHLARVNGQFAYFIDCGAPVTGQ